MSLETSWVLQFKRSLHGLFDLQFCRVAGMSGLYRHPKTDQLSRDSCWNAVRDWFSSFRLGLESKRVLTETLSSEKALKL